MKYPRILHIPGSPGTQSDDRIMSSDQWEFLRTNPVVATVKMDGENTTMTRDTIHARSEDSIDHQSRHYVKQVWGQIRHQIPEGYRIVGENLYAKHSIHYTDLSDWFQVFAVFDDQGTLRSNLASALFTAQMNLRWVPPCGGVAGWFATGEEAVSALKDFDPTTQEGFVLRYPGDVQAHEHETRVAKWVRKGHVQSSTHWMYQEVVVNGRSNQA